MTVVSETVTMDGLRVVQEHGDGTTTFREPSLGEQVGSMLPDLQRQVQGMVPHAMSSAVSMSVHGTEGVVLHVSLARGGQAMMLPVSGPQVWASAAPHDPEPELFAATACAIPDEPDEPAKAKPPPRKPRSKKS